MRILALLCLSIFIAGCPNKSGGPSSAVGSITGTPEPVALAKSGPPTGNPPARPAPVIRCQGYYQRDFVVGESWKGKFACVDICTTSLVGECLDQCPNIANKPIYGDGKQCVLRTGNPILAPLVAGSIEAQCTAAYGGGAWVFRITLSG